VLLQVRVLPGPPSFAPKTTFSDWVLFSTILQTQEKLVYEPYQLHASWMNNLMRFIKLGPTAVLKKA
jgi:hypothetical protein